MHASSHKFQGTHNAYNSKHSSIQKTNLQSLQTNSSSKPYNHTKIQVSNPYKYNTIQPIQNQPRQAGTRYHAGSVRVITSSDINHRCLVPVPPPEALQLLIQLRPRGTKILLRDTKCASGGMNALLRRGILIRRRHRHILVRPKHLSLTHPLHLCIVSPRICTPRLRITPSEVVTRGRNKGP